MPEESPSQSLTLLTQTVQECSKIKKRVPEFMLQFAVSDFRPGHNAVTAIKVVH